MKYANDNPRKVALVTDYKGMYANSHPYKVVVTAGDGIATEEWVNDRLEGIARIVTELPPEGEPAVTYFILKETTSEGNIYDEYMWLTKQDGTMGWEKIGATDVIQLEVDDTLSNTSENPVQNKVITNALGGKASITYANSLVANTEEWEFTLKDGTTVTKEVVLAPGE